MLCCFLHIHVTYRFVMFACTHLNSWHACYGLRQWNIFCCFCFFSNLIFPSLFKFYLIDIYLMLLDVDNNEFDSQNLFLGVSFKMDVLFR